MLTSGIGNLNRRQGNLFEIFSIKQRFNYEFPRSNLLSLKSLTIPNQTHMYTNNHY